jgi:hypothetical protein
MASAGGTHADPEKHDSGAQIYVPEGAGEATIEEGADVANDTTGGYLTSSSLGVPVVAEHGLTDYVWSNAAATEPSPNLTPFKAAYFFASHDIPFTHFLIPEALPGGDSEFEIRIGEYESYPLQAGVPFVFTDYFPEGVTAFLLTGFNADEGLMAGEPFPYTHGYRFAEEGATFVRHGPLKPGDFTLGGLVDEEDLTLWQSSFGVDDSGDADGDGDTDGRDFLFWQRNYYPGEAPPAVGTDVPEPSIQLLLGIGCMTILACSRAVVDSSIFDRIGRVK